MATQTYKTPGVYIQEPNSFPPSIVGVETAVPCFIGYTYKANAGDGRDLHMVPKRIDSMAEFVQYFGPGYPERYFLVKIPKPVAEPVDPKKTREQLAEEEKAKENAKKAESTSTDHNWGAITLDGVNRYNLLERGQENFNLYNSMRLFYANGGGGCFVISCGIFGGPGGVPQIKPKDITDALEVCKTFIGPTMVAIPDAVLISDPAEFMGVAVAMLKTCAEAGDRMALIDIHGVDKLGRGQEWEPAIEKFRLDLKSGTNPEEWRFGAAYFPPLVTSIVAADEIDISNFASDALDTLKEALGAALLSAHPATPASEAKAKEKKAAAEKAEADRITAGGTPLSTEELAKKPAPNPALAKLDERGANIQASYIDMIGVAPALPATLNPEQKAEAERKAVKQLTQNLVATVPGFKQLLAAIAATQGVLPPSGAIAGVWTANDVIRGVWNAPANVGIATMIAPKLPINHEQQQDLNAPTQGLAVNAIRTFQGRGSLIWGARTLDSNSNDWRYIQVRRTMIYVEQSVKQALEAMVFKPNTAQTWVTVVSMIESFLHGLWSSGGLMGATPGEAYVVQAGLGSTMTPDDVLNGIMRVHITLQMVHPAEFIELTFKQQMLGGA